MLVNCEERELFEEGGCAGGEPCVCKAWATAAADTRHLEVDWWPSRCMSVQPLSVAGGFAPDTSHVVIHPGIQLGTPHPFTCVVHWQQEEMEEKIEGIQSGGSAAQPLNRHKHKRGTDTDYGSNIDLVP